MRTVDGSWNPAAPLAKSGLADANQLIYRTISPAMAFSAKYGAKQMQACLRSEDVVTKDALKDLGVTNHKIDNTVVHPEIALAVDSLAAGQSCQAAGQIANFEQGTVVQDRIYDNRLNREVFGWDQTIAEYKAGRAMGA